MLQLFWPHLLTSCSPSSLPPPPPLLRVEQGTQWQSQVPTPHLPPGYDMSLFRVPGLEDMLANVRPLTRQKDLEVARLAPYVVLSQTYTAAMRTNATSEFVLDLSKCLIYAIYKQAGGAAMSDGPEADWAAELERRAKEAAARIRGRLDKAQRLMDGAEPSTSDSDSGGAGGEIGGSIYVLCWALREFLHVEYQCMKRAALNVYI